MDAEPAPQNDVKAATTSTGQTESAGSEASTTEHDPKRPDPELSDPGTPASSQAPPRELTRRYTDVSDDDRDVGWGERPALASRDDDWYLSERPPHHG